MKLASLVLLSLLAASCKPSTEPSSDVLFAGGEHKVLGDDAYKAACAASSDCPEKLFRADKKEAFTYGELVAFSGDFYETPFEIYNEKNTQSFLHPSAANLQKIRSLFSDEEAATRKQMTDPEMSYPDNNLGFVFAFPKYLELATRNTNHFGWHNMKFYVKYHTDALNMAIEARDQKTKAAREEMFTRALFLNAFADHFLTDGFATGHIRNPRAQSLAWQQKNKFGKTAIDSLAKLVHDHDHLLRETHGPGLKVLNARGDTWHTRCDGELFTLAQKSDKQVAIPIEAVQLSVNEVLKAYKEGVMPEGTYKGAELVPFLAPDEDSLIAVFNDKVPEEQIKAWLKSLGVINYFSFFIGLSPQMTRTYFAALPDIMEQFRADVAADSKDAELIERLPAAYIAGFRNIR